MLVDTTRTQCVDGPDEALARDDVRVARAEVNCPHCLKPGETTYRLNQCSQCGKWFEVTDGDN